MTRSKPNGTATAGVVTRPLAEIAAEICENWPKPYFGAVPYIEAMGRLNLITDAYGADDAETIVIYFLSNATYWRGPKAARSRQATEHAVMSGLGTGRCTMCENDVADLIPWAGERLCWDCTDLQLDLLALTLADLPVTVGAGVRTPGHVTTIELRSMPS